MATISAWIVTSSAVVGSSAIEQLRARGERAGDHHALEHAARERAGVGAEHPLAVDDADVGEQLERPRPRLGPAEPAVDAQALHQVVAARPERIDVRARVLEDHRDPLARSARSSFCAERQQVDAVEQDLPGHERLGGSRRRIVRAVIDLPLPDSPTRPTTSPWPIVRSRRRSASACPRREIGRDRAQLQQRLAHRAHRDFPRARRSGRRRG